MCRPIGYSFRVLSEQYQSNSPNFEQKSCIGENKTQVTKETDAIALFMNRCD